VNKDCDMSNPTYNIEFDIEFATVGDYAAQYLEDSTFNYGTNSNIPGIASFT
jgi:hypothetical protein